MRQRVRVFVCARARARVCGYVYIARLDIGRDTREIRELRIFLDESEQLMHRRSGRRSGLFEPRA